jgi:diaminohydroxyphosphoribosylaminopyrimidine deaminase/5-amino-6-(5-phosphoribosylamino)uracil reductase
MVGAGTVCADDPRLTGPEGGRQRSWRKASSARHGSQPFKIIVDSNGRTPPSARLLRSGKTLIVTTNRASANRLHALRANGAEIIAVGSRRGAVRLRDLMTVLFRRGVGSILCEGGETLARAMIGEGLVDRMVAVIAPKLMGNRPVAGTMVMGNPEITRIGADLVIRAERNGTRPILSL